ncbi:MAG TPA: hypothetical protein VL633_13585 [Bacteroidota bacterium]|jgi:hypothetical protein|nr:hypothetical protein [Bacteroidota bacterium]
MANSDFVENIRRTLLYYEIFDHPLTLEELFYLFPRNSLTKSEFTDRLRTLTADGSLSLFDGYYTLPSLPPGSVELREKREKLAARRLKMARFMSQIIRRFPFVRGVFLSGDLSKGVAHEQSDIDYVIVTKSRRLWVCRSLLVLFKKIFLLNSRKYFCLNYFVAEDHLLLEDRNYYTATEIAHLKPLYNIEMFIRYMNANSWIKGFFPNYKVFALSDNETGGRNSFIRSVLEIPFMWGWIDSLDSLLMKMMKRVWEKRYPHYDATTREKLFRCTPTESCAYVGNFSDKILGFYRDKLDRNNLKL